MKKKPLYLAASFLIPMLILLYTFITLHIAPFGNKTLVFGDSNGYYINYLAYLRNALSGDCSLYYSFSKGLGGNISHLTSFFFMRPDIALYKLAGWNYLPHAFSIYVILITSACGLTMYLLLADIYGYELSNLIFSTSYALMGFMTVNNYIIVFHMGVVMLPFMLLGIRKILRGENPALYVLSIGYAIASHFQMGFIVCMASVFFFIACKLLEDQPILTLKKTIIRYIAASLTGGFIGGLIWLPALISLIGGRLTQTQTTDYEFTDTQPILYMGARLFSGASSANQLINGLPAIFCGILVVFLAILFYLDEHISLKKKIVSAVLLVIYLFSFYIKGINNIFQGFGHANWFNFRQSFVFSFILILMAREELCNIHELELKKLFKALGILVIASLLIFSNQYEFISGGNYAGDLIILAVMAAAMIYHIKSPQKADYRSLVILLLICTSLQMYINYYVSVGNVLKTWGKTATVDKFSSDIAERLPIVEGITGSDTSFYRMELEDGRTQLVGNDPMMFSYNGVGHTSYERDFVNANMSRLGISWRGGQSNYYGKGMTASMDSLLGIKYIVSRRDLTMAKGYTALTQGTEDTIYLNPYTLPIAIVANDEAGEVSLESTKDIFDLQNQIWQKMTGEADNLFEQVTQYQVEVHNPIESITTNSDEVMELAALLKLDEKTESEEEEDSASDSTSDSIPWTEEDVLLDDVGNELYPNSPYLEITFPADRDGAVYMYDSSAVQDKYGTDETVLKYLGYYHKGETVTGRIYYSYNIDKAILATTVKGLYVYYNDDSVLHNYSAILCGRHSQIIKEKDTRLSGTVTIEDDQMLLFTIPYDSGWELYVDGHKTELKKTMDLFMSADLTPGEHSYEMIYTAPGLWLGLALSICALLSLIAQCFLCRK